MHCVQFVSISIGRHTHTHTHTTRTVQHNTALYSPFTVPVAYFLLQLTLLPSVMRTCHQAVNTSNCRTPTSLSQLCSSASPAISQSINCYIPKVTRIAWDLIVTHLHPVHCLTTTTLPSTPSSPKWSLSVILFVYTFVCSRLARVLVPVAYNQNGQP
jgi:hypothetical protein